MIRYFLPCHAQTPKNKWIAVIDEIYGASPYNKRIELTARGRHVGCLRNRRAGFTLRVRRCAGRSGPCSQLIRALCGRTYRVALIALFLCSCSSKLICREEILFINEKDQVLRIELGTYRHDIRYDKKEFGNLDCPKWYALLSDSAFRPQRRQGKYRSLKVGNACGHYELSKLKIYIEDTSVVKIDSLKYLENGWYARIWVKSLKNGETKLVLEDSKDQFTAKLINREKSVEAENAVHYRRQ